MVNRNLKIPRNALIHSWRFLLVTVCKIVRFQSPALFYTLQDEAMVTPYQILIKNECDIGWFDLLVDGCKIWGGFLRPGRDMWAGKVSVSSDHDHWDFLTCSNSIFECFCVSILLIVCLTRCQEWQVPWYCTVVEGRKTFDIILQCLIAYSIPVQIVSEIWLVGRWVTPSGT